MKHPPTKHERVAGDLAAARSALHLIRSISGAQTGRAERSLLAVINALEWRVEAARVLRPEVSVILDATAQPPSASP